MDRTTYSQYQNIIRKGAWAKFSEQHGVPDILISLAVSILLGVVSWKVLRIGVASILTALATLVIFFLVYTIFYLGFFAREHLHTYNLQNNKIASYQAKIDSLNTAPPTILAKAPMIKPKGFVDGHRNAISIDVYSRPKTKNGYGEAKKVYPTVKWYEGKNLITENSGRWWIANEDKATMKKIDQQVMDLSANGMPAEFHFAIQEPNDNAFSTWSRSKDGSDERFRLTGKKYTVRICFQSENYAKANFDYLVENQDGQLFIKKANRNQIKTE